MSNEDLHEHNDHDHHAHGHVHSGMGKNLGIAAGITTFIMVVEIIGGILTNSLALISDAGHMLVDVLSLVLSLFAYNYSKKPATEKNTFGFYRVEILVALLNGISLGVLSVFILYESWQRLFTVPEIKSLPVIYVAIIGLISNVVSGLFLMKDSKHNINIRGAYLHIIGDALSSVGVIIAGLLMLFFGWFLADSLVSIIIALMILKGGWGLVKESVLILLEAVPEGFDISKIGEDIKNTADAREVHHVHVWTLSSKIHALSCHVKIKDMKITESEELVINIQEMLKIKYDIKHVTIQFECEDCAEPPDHLKEE
ncbi:MAG: hypothetical protein A2452_06265 [Candidatus Firestonebacteria bacterium RIFOXYC2_FULL_39_67]|nr:MAG: hypothetical protein A2536_00900 [Candidatus Firestonebacteria bacterium RIFOXYD2_FULL_39_29]OGF53827.1 MAG: hypothetical protein A2452_06265 [Candidatus Firestonebacteria bacterium RIFOXYC2_FULL_39_67]OGF56844.1 MAG: hypothetical protein A2497_02270 [Candidatus Firestonebacteria bacterium RifOxyC12_full_39_7]